MLKWLGTCAISEKKLKTDKQLNLRLQSPSNGSMLNTIKLNLMKRSSIDSRVVRLITVCLIALTSFNVFANGGNLEENLVRAEKNFHQGQLYYENDSYDEAINEFSSAISLAPDNSEYHHWLAKAYGELAEKSGWVKALKLADKSRESLEHAVKLDPENISALTDLMKFYQQAPVFLGGSDQKAKEIGIRLKALQDKTPDIHGLMMFEFDKQIG